MAIDLITVRFIQMLNFLAAMTKAGFIPWQDYTEQSKLYFPSTPVIYDLDRPREIDGITGYPIVSQHILGNGDKQLISTYDTYIPGERILVTAFPASDEDDGEGPYIEVTINDTVVVISDGVWEAIQF